ncbi:MAG: hypothetical protein EOP10_08860 [Proteobacteria bacterium]|nr:MAG: hypothetical protein EOP10_08860 [Pseudomonadota bacterium]
MQRVLLCLAVLFASPLFANSKTLLVNGVYAATYGDIGMDKGDWRDNNYSAIRLKAGIQVVRVDFVSLTLGFQKVGFYTGLSKWDGDSNYAWDYRGPVAEIHLFPDSPIGFSGAYFTGSGYSFMNTASKYSKDAVDSCTTDCTIETERSHLKVEEFTAYVTVKIASGLQLFAGAGTRHVTGDPEYDFRRSSVNVREKFDDAPKWREDNGLLLVGLRGTTL